MFGDLEQKWSDFKHGGRAISGVQQIQLKFGLYLGNINEVWSIWIRFGQLEKGLVQLSAESLFGMVVAQNEGSDVVEEKETIPHS